MKSNLILSDEPRHKITKLAKSVVTFRRIKHSAADDIFDKKLSAKNMKAVVDYAKTVMQPTLDRIRNLQSASQRAKKKNGVAKIEVKKWEVLILTQYHYNAVSRVRRKAARKSTSFTEFEKSEGMKQSQCHFARAQQLHLLIDPYRPASQ